MGLRVNWVIFLNVDQNVESVDNTNKIEQNHCYYLSEQVNILFGGGSMLTLTELSPVSLRVNSPDLMQMDYRSEFSHFCKLLDSPLRRNLSDD
jgi:hypothetical protein